MKRDLSLAEISDGKLYGLNDMVRADCGDCKDCHACCQGMGDSVVLDPFDVYRIGKKLNCTAESLLRDKLKLQVVDGIVLPGLNMDGPDERCGFLSSKGRCTIHDARPGICRLFPLGRLYEEEGCKYFLQIHECKNEKRSKIKVKKWIDTPELKKYEACIWSWHCLLKELQDLMNEAMDEVYSKRVSMTVLQTFYLQPYKAERDFYDSFYERVKKVKEGLSIVK